MDKPVAVHGNLQILLNFNVFFTFFAKPRVKEKAMQLVKMLKSSKKKFLCVLNLNVFVMRSYCDNSRFLSNLFDFTIFSKVKVLKRANNFIEHVNPPLIFFGGQKWRQS